MRELLHCDVDEGVINRQKRRPLTEVRGEEERMRQIPRQDLTDQREVNTVVDAATQKFLPETHSLMPVMSVNL